MEDIPSSFDYTLIDSFTANPYGIAKKYDLPQTMFQHDFKNLEE